MAGIIVIGERGQTRAYATAGLRCFEPGPGHLVERVLAERFRCEVLALTRTAFDALPAALARDLRHRLGPTLAILPEAETAADGLREADRLIAMLPHSGPAAA
ncbi:MAG: hypothetical protein R3D59_12865 [Paracoccaceae bacterium]